MEKQKINLIFMGGFTFPDGMAGTKRIKHTIDALKPISEVMIQVLLLRQLGPEKCYSGVYQGISYKTIMAGLTRNRFMILFPVLFLKAFFYLKKALSQDSINIIYHYGPITHENFIPLYFARILGYKIVFDIVEDYDLAVDLSKSIFHKLRILGIKCFQSKMKEMADGLIVISSYLEDKYKKRDATKRIKMHYRPISIEMNRFQVSEAKNRKSKEVSLFYAGSFGKKDGVLDLIDAFDCLAAKKKNVRLVLTGRGTKEDMALFFARVQSSPFKPIIDYRGFLDEDDYYDVLNSVDIHCMTRTDLDYSNAGFPFKLGEYLATGKPVIASRVSDIDCFLDQGKNAMIVKPGCPEEIEAAAAFLIDNPDNALQIGNSGRNVAFSNFDHKVQGKKLFYFIKTL